MTLLSTVTTATVTNESVFFPYLIAVLQIAPRQTGGGKGCSRVKGGGRMAGGVDIFNVKKYCVLDFRLSPCTECSKLSLG